MQDQWFEWDDRKAASNLAKHDISFDEARQAFDDQFIVDELDDSADYDEDRFFALALYNGAILAIAYTMRDERIRIISARRASKQEILKYEHNRPTK